MADDRSDFRYVECCKCGIRFGSPILNRRLEDGDDFYCPLGHPQCFIDARESRDARARDAARRIKEEEELYAMLHPLNIKPEPVAQHEKGWLARRISR